jgi:hypothetical protein
MFAWQMTFAGVVAATPAVLSGVGTATPARRRRRTASLLNR